MTQPIKKRQPSVTPKRWGADTAIAAGQTFAVHRICVEDGGFCSRHVHVGKANAFFVEKGRLQIEVWEEQRGYQTTTLGPGDSITIPAGVEHRFSADMDVVAYEVYWVCLDPADIKRYSESGVQGQENKNGVTVP